MKRMSLKHKRAQTRIVARMEMCSCHRETSLQLFDEDYGFWVYWCAECDIEVDQNYSLMGDQVMKERRGETEVKETVFEYGRRGRCFVCDKSTLTAINMRIATVRVDNVDKQAWVCGPCRADYRDRTES